MPISVNVGGFGFGGAFGHKGSAPSPFDAVNGPRLAGPQGSHPLHAISPEDLLRPGDGAVAGEIVLDRSAVVGDGMTGRLRFTTIERIDARRANLRLVGLRLDETRQSLETTDSDGHVTSSEHWVEARGRLFVEDAFLEPAIPTTLEPGATFEAPIVVPSPPLGPPTAHLGESIIAWALEVRWDVAMGADHFLAAYLPLAQHPDLLRAGVGKQGGTSLLDSIDVSGATIAVTSPLPAPAGSDMVVDVRWPSAPGGSKGRIELHRRTNAPNGTEGVIASTPIDPADLRGGIEVRLAVPAGSAPSFDGAGLEIGYVVRVLVDRRFMADAAIERPVAVV